jgi:RNA polymerase sigma factor
MEIEAINIECAKWGFSWELLLKKCPKQARSRRIACQIADAVLQDSVLLADTLKTRQLPFSRLTTKYSRKALEKYRHYIAALIILSKGDYPYVYSFAPHYPGEEHE